MKKIILFFLLLIAACKSTSPFATNPDKNAFNSGTIGSVKATDNAETNVNPNISLPVKDSTIIKADTSRRQNQFEY
ncbi:MAG TPA: hypothetical protein VHZ50_00430 [Puia sp.]|jgi:hypothetical protein|nr:hypothetical protein [Puia sp.]